MPTHLNEQTPMHNIRSCNTNTNHGFSDQNPNYTFNLKMKAQAYDGSTDVCEYLTQFNLVAEINNWDYKAKSLYLASSLTGNARSILTELSELKRRDFDCLVEILMARYGTKNKAEIFRSQLKSIHREKDQSITEFAIQIKKLTRQAYPDASSELIELLALDHFTDSLDDSDIRLRLRECCPKTISEAETIAVRLETHKLADQQRLQSVNAVNYSKTNHADSDMDEVKRKIDILFKKIDTIDSNTSQNTTQTYSQNTFRQNRNNEAYQYNRQNVGGRFTPTYVQNRAYNQRKGYSNRYNGNNHTQGRYENNHFNQQNTNYTHTQNNQGNGVRSSWGTATRLPQN